MPPLLGFYQKQGSYPYDPAKAKALLAEAGYPNGFEATLTGGNNTLAQRGMQFVQQQLAAVGVTLKVEPLEAGVLTAKMFNVQKPEDAIDRDAVWRLVVVHRRCGLGHAADAVYASRSRRCCRTSRGTAARRPMRRSRRG